MKGITHFVLGVAWASCFPGVVRSGMAGSAYDFVLGGIFGLLPDTLDFKFYRFLYRHDVEVTPDPNRPDPNMIAGAIVDAVHTVHATGKPVRVKLNTMPVGTGVWRSYSIEFNRRARRLEVGIGPVVDAGLSRVRRDDECCKLRATRTLACDVKIGYEADITVNIFDGPVLEFAGTSGDRIEIGFIPWHRHWTHSLVTGLIAALCVAALHGVRSGAVALGAWWMHVAVDQTGFLGCNLFHPFTRRRTPGLLWAESGDAACNAWLVWLGMLLVVGNLWDQSHAWQTGTATIRFLVWGGIVPLALLRILRQSFSSPAQDGPLRRRRRVPRR